MEREDLRKTSELPAVELEGGRAWVFNHDPLGVFSHRVTLADNAEGKETSERTE